MKYGVVFVDDFSRHMRVYYCTHKSEVPRLLRLYFAEMGSHALYASHFVLHAGFARNNVYTDGGTELSSSQFEQCLLDIGLSANVVSAPDTPSSNGVAERAVRTLCSATRARLAMSGLPNRLWTYAMTHSAACRNRLATQLAATGEPVTPSELFCGRRPDVSHMAAFGAPCLVALQGPALRARGKLRLRSVPGKILHQVEGIQRDGGGLRLVLGFVVLLDDGSIHYSRHVRIDERSLVAGGHTPFSSAEPDLPDDPEGDPMVAGLDSHTEAQTTAPPARHRELHSNARATTERHAAAPRLAAHERRLAALPAGRFILLSMKTMIPPWPVMMTLTIYSIHLQHLTTMSRRAPTTSRCRTRPSSRHPTRLYADDYGGSISTSTLGFELRPHEA
jgi:hypothetical protein